MDAPVILHNELAHHLFQASVIAQCLLSHDGRIIAVNPALCQLVGTTEGEVLDSTLAQLFPKEEGEGLLECFRGLVAGKETSIPPLDIAQVLHRKDGTNRLTRNRLSVLPGQPGTILLQIEDVAEFYQLQETYRILEQRSTRGFNNMFCGLARISPERNYIQVNPALCKLLGYTEEELLGMNCLALIHPDDTPAAEQAIEQLLRLEIQSCRTEERYIHKNGSTVWTVNSIFPTLDEAGKVIYLISQSLDITSYKKLENSLLVEQEKLRLAFNNAAIGMALVAPQDGRYLKVNPRLCEITGYPEEELITKRVSDITHPADQARDVLVLKGLADGSMPHCDMEKRYIHKDGHVVWVNLFSSGAYDPENQLMYYVSQMLDITHRKQMEQALRASEEKFKQAFENAAIGIAVITANGYIVEANRQLRQMLGYTIQEIRALTYAALTHPDDRERDRQTYEDMGNLKIATYSHEKRFIHKNGNVIWAAVAGSSMFDEQEKRISFVAQITDISEKKQVEQAYQQSEQKFRNAFYNASIGMAISSPEGRWQQVNQAICDILGYTEAELLNMDFQRVTHPDDLEKSCFFLEQMKTGKVETFTLEKRYIHKEGRVIWIQLNISAVYDEDRRLTHQIAQIQDISERVEADRRLRLAKEQAESAAQAKADFLSTMSHEIRTPLNAVLGMSYLLEETPLNEEQKELVDTIRSGGRNLLGIINDILDFSRIESGKMEMEWQPVHLNACIEEVMSLFRQKAKEKGLLFTRSIDPAIPASICSDNTRLKQILINLIGNAIKFTASGSVQITVTAGEERSEPTVRHDSLTRLVFSVQDTGCGIPSEKLDSIFEAFTQVDASTTRQFGGTGLGLSISSKLASLLGGMIEVESEPGQGSCFRLILPAQPATGEQSEKQSPSLPTSRQGDAYPLRILIVEDNRTNQILMERILQNLGYLPTLVSSGYEALTMLSRSSFDLVLMDVQMPGMDGLQTTRLIRQQCAGETPPVIIALTAYVLPEDRKSFLENGMDDLIDKPVSPTGIAAKLRDWHQRIHEEKAKAKVAPVQDASVDEACLLHRLSHDREILREMTDLYQVDGERLIRGVTLALETGDPTQALELLHELKGVSIALSAKRMQQLAMQFEGAVRQNQSDNYSTLLTQLRIEYERTVSALQTLAQAPDRRADKPANH